MGIILLIIKIFFWGFVLAIFHSYVLFPLLLNVLAKGKTANKVLWDINDENNLPLVSIIIAAYNEEQVIGEKIESILHSHYPDDKIEVLIGSDNSTDNTDEIVKKFAENYPKLQLYSFTERQGKAKIVNNLSEKANGSILILTDANVYFTEMTIYHLVKHYKNEEIALVGGLIENTNLKKNGISLQEKTYLTNENTIKYREGILWGAMIGAFGGIYSIRKTAYKPVPLNFFMDDFYITMHVLQDGGKAIQELDAVCHEDISNLIHEEFRRKVRISIGNFQNLKVFWKLSFPLTSGRGFSFMSHKIIRWFTPFLIIDCLLFSGVLSIYDTFYFVLFAGFVFSLLIPFFDYLLKKIHIHIVLLRYVTHFYSMNLALLIGFFKYMKGVDSNVWQPTKRNQ